MAIDKGTKAQAVKANNEGANAHLPRFCAWLVAMEFALRKKRHPRAPSKVSATVRQQEARGMTREEL